MFRLSIPESPRIILNNSVSFSSLTEQSCSTLLLGVRQLFLFDRRIASQAGIWLITEAVEDGEAGRGIVARQNKSQFAGGAEKTVSVVAGGKFAAGSPLERVA